jgi:hypothetical protein
MLNSGEVQNSSKARPLVRSAIKWCHSVLEELSPKTVQKCWNHNNILLGYYLQDLRTQ